MTAAAPKPGVPQLGIPTGHKAIDSGTLWGTEITRMLVT